jgi:hypothetical protein
MNWVERRANREAAATANCDLLWQAVMSAAEGACQSFNKRYGNRDLNAEIDTSGITSFSVILVRFASGGACPQVHASLDRQQQIVKVRSLGPDKEFIFKIEADDNGAASLVLSGKQMEADAISELILGPLFFPAPSLRPMKYGA